MKAPGQKKFQAEIIAADPRSDLAVIVPREGAGVPRPKLTPIALGDAGKLRKGSFLVALGNPYNAAREDGRAVGEPGNPRQSAAAGSTRSPTISSGISPRSSSSTPSSTWA